MREWTEKHRVAARAALANDLEARVSLRAAGDVIAFARDSEDWEQALRDIINSPGMPPGQGGPERSASADGPSRGGEAPGGAGPLPSDGSETASGERGEARPARVADGGTGA